MKPARSSQAGTNQGISEPHWTRNLNFKRGGERIAVGVKWHGGEYDSEKCWIKCDIGDLIPVEE